jgi:hypothetical protein
MLDRNDLDHDSIDADSGYQTRSFARATPLPAAMTLVLVALATILLFLLRGLFSLLNLVHAGGSQWRRVHWSLTPNVRPTVSHAGSGGPQLDDLRQLPTVRMLYGACGGIHVLADTAERELRRSAQSAPTSCWRSDLALCGMRFALHAWSDFVTSITRRREPTWRQHARLREITSRLRR